ncbi:DUF3549 family protein [Colwellia sp. MSW7]|uniref:DUF3549 family protein n=1 Tax=Colwellia maritima TaxID=2912588 RepID=A0ABS9WZM8_9GAMM|nr:DUF3549 family protein [Colwellia maritima]MCI2283468.1 DUF3549 family protein [Colwellia maritima]
MNTIDTISQLLHSSNSQFNFYDVGRKIEKIPKTQFDKIESNKIPYPTPSQGHACFAITFWQKKSTQPYLWLLKLPLDERGLLNQGARNHFIAIIIEALGSDLTQDANEQQTELLKNNPYLFTPAQYKLASLNSKIKYALKQMPSEHFTPFVEYICGMTNWDKWQEIGVQGITDFAVRINDKNNSQTLISALPHIPNEVLFPLCSALENESFSVDLVNAILSLLLHNVQAANSSPKQSESLINTQQHLIRSLASNCHHMHVKQFIHQLLAQQSVAPELLITLSSRCWPALSEPKTISIFFEHLLTSGDATLFTSIFKDLVAIPTIRPIILECIRSPSRSGKLSHAIGQLFN